jgi:hypothetical protein
MACPCNDGFEPIPDNPYRCRHALFCVAFTWTQIGIVVVSVVAPIAYRGFILFDAKRRDQRRWVDTRKFPPVMPIMKLPHAKGGRAVLRRI